MAKTKPNTEGVNGVLFTALVKLFGGDVLMYSFTCKHPMLRTFSGHQNKLVPRCILKENIISIRVYGLEEQKDLRMNRSSDLICKFSNDFRSPFDLKRHSCVCNVNQHKATWFH